MFTSVKITGSSARGAKGALVVGVLQPSGKGALKLDERTAKLDEGGEIARALSRPEATGEAGNVVQAFPARGWDRVVIVGLGKPDKLDREALISAAAAAGRRLSDAKAQDVTIDLSGPLAHQGVRADAAGAGQAFGEALGLLAYAYEELKGSGTKKKEHVRTLSVRCADRAMARGFERGLALAGSVNASRRLSETPPNIATPEWMAEQARAIARGTGLTVTVVKGAALKQKKLVGIETVGRASENPPCLIRIAYKPAGAKAGARPLVIVGKTMTYDTGGLSIKPTSAMTGMKGDKDGGCAVLGAMHAIATVIKPRRPVVALLCVAENSISANAYRPDDVLTFRNGVTVEITNTDAEGRLVMADGLCMACKEENAAYVVDVATLTGGVITALGSTYAGMWCEDEALREKVVAASAATGERVWRLPMHREYTDMMKSSVADIVNSNPNRKAHATQGAAFLSYFVQEGTPWCHLDVAGVHRAETDAGPLRKDTASGFGVRLLAALADSL